MESEKEDILFFFGKTLRTLMRTENDMIHMIVGKFSNYIRYTISEKNLKRSATAKLGGMVSKWLSNKEEQVESSSNAEAILDPLIDHLNDNFEALEKYLSPNVSVKIMQKTWDTVLDSLEALILPPLAGKPTSQAALTQEEQNDLLIWISALEKFFYCEGDGIPMEELHSQRFEDLINLGLKRLYNLSTGDLIQLAEQHAIVASREAQKHSSFVVSEQVQRSGTIMAHRNRKALRAEQKKLKETQKKYPGTEDIILRILLLRGEHPIVARHLEHRMNLSKSYARR